jgi:hypothetical protein
LVTRGLSNNLKNWRDINDSDDLEVENRANAVRGRSGIDWWLRCATPAGGLDPKGFRDWRQSGCVQDGAGYWFTNSNPSLYIERR